MFIEILNIETKSLIGANAVSVDQTLIKIHFSYRYYMETEITEYLLFLLLYL